MSFKNKLLVAFHILVIITLIVLLAFEFVEPHPNKFKSFVRIVLWVIFLFFQIGHLHNRLKTREIKA